MKFFIILLLRFFLFLPLKDLEAVYLQQLCSIILLLREIMKSQFPSNLIEESVRRRKDRAVDEMENRVQYPVAEDTPRPGNRQQKGMFFYKNHEAH